MAINKGMFSIDAIIATSILVLGVIVTIVFYSQSETGRQIDYLPFDIVESTSNSLVMESRNEYVRHLIENGYVDEQSMNISVLEFAAKLWVTNKTNESRKLIQNISEPLLPPSVAIGFYIDDSEVYRKGNLTSRYVIAARRLVSGIEEGKPVSGTTARAHLASIGEKITSLFSYFGGFVGQGNITRFFTGLPMDANITEVKLELDAGSWFRTYINDQQCLGIFNVTRGNLSASVVDLTPCSNLFVKDPDFRNNITLEFIEGMLTAYIGGGFLKVTYETSNIIDPGIYNVSRHYMSGIQGVVNLYSSFYVPGELENLSMYLHYTARESINSTNPFYVRIGNNTVFIDENSTGEQKIHLNSSDFLEKLNISQFNESTIPLRIGYVNATLTGTYKGAADIIIITDLSESMQKEINSTQGGNPRECDDPDFFLGSTRRLSVAKCVDKDFAKNLTDAEDIKVGLVAYGTTTRDSETVPLTRNMTLLNETIGTALPVTGYSPAGNTCICCGINSAVIELEKNLTRTILISNGSIWKWTNTSFTGPPPTDSSGKEWFEPAYNDSGWNSGNAILGGNYQSGLSLATDMGFATASQVILPEMWEVAADGGTPEVEFNSGLNWTANTFGPNGSNDGWDSACGIWGGPSSCADGFDTYHNFDPNGDGSQSDNTVASDNEIYVGVGKQWDQGLDDIPNSVAAGVTIAITSAAFAKISGNGSALLTFDYSIDRSTSIKPGEAGWVKAQFGNGSSMVYLGNASDSGGITSDNTSEIYWCEDDVGSNPCEPDPWSDTFQQDLAPFINSSGNYYLILGGKAAEDPNDNSWDNTWKFYFDDVLLEVFDGNDKYYLRNTFEITNTSEIQQVFFNLLSDDTVRVYINGFVAYEQKKAGKGEYWDERGIMIDTKYVVPGTNTVAVELKNPKDDAKFDMEVIGLNDTRIKAMLVMTDGIATQTCPEQGTGDPSSDAIKAACEAAERYGAISYGVGFSSEADADTLASIAECGNGIYKVSSDPLELLDFYRDIARTIILLTSQTQAVTLSGGTLETSRLFADSYVEMNYTASINDSQFGIVTFTIEGNDFNNCSLQQPISNKVKILDAKVISYSSDLWTDELTINGKNEFNLSFYNQNYTRLGDPFLIHAPGIKSGLNNLEISTGFALGEESICSQNSSFVYSGGITANIPYSQIYPFAVGCTWHVEYEGGGTSIIPVPVNYSGSKVCAFNSSQVWFDVNDSVDWAAYELFEALDLYDTNKTFINFGELNIQIQIISIPRAPYLWGPAVVDVRVAQ